MFLLDDLVLLILFGATGATIKWLASDDTSSDNMHTYDSEQYLPRAWETPPTRNQISSGTGQRHYSFDRETGRLRYGDED
jgi:hypothetical protein